MEPSSESPSAATVVTFEKYSLDPPIVFPPPRGDGPEWAGPVVGPWQYISDPRERKRMRAIDRRKMTFMRWWPSYKFIRLLPTRIRMMALVDDIVPQQAAYEEGEVPEKSETYTAYQYRAIENVVAMCEFCGENPEGLPRSIYGGLCEDCDNQTLCCSRCSSTIYGRINR